MQNEKKLDSTNEQPHTWLDSLNRQVEHARQVRQLEVFEKLKTKSERSRYDLLMQKECRIPQTIRELRKFWKIEKDGGFWYVRFAETGFRWDVIVPTRPYPGLLILGLERDGINKLVGLTRAIAPKSGYTSSDRFLAHRLKLDQILELLEVVKELTSRFAPPDFLPTIEEWDARA